MKVYYSLCLKMLAIFTKMCLSICTDRWKRRITKE